MKNSGDISNDWVYISGILHHQGVSRQGCPILQNYLPAALRPYTICANHRKMFSSEYQIMMMMVWNLRIWRLLHLRLRLTKTSIRLWNRPVRRSSWQPPTCAASFVWVVYVGCFACITVQPTVVTLVLHVLAIVLFIAVHRKYILFILMFSRSHSSWSD